MLELQTLSTDGAGFIKSSEIASEPLAKQQISEAIQATRITNLSISEGGMNLKTTGINRLINPVGVKALSGQNQ